VGGRKPKGDQFYPLGGKVIKKKEKTSPKEKLNKVKMGAQTVKKTFDPL